MRTAHTTSLVQFFMLLILSHAHTLLQYSNIIHRRDVSISSPRVFISFATSALCTHVIINVFCNTYLISSFMCKSHANPIKRSRENEEKKIRNPNVNQCLKSLYLFCRCCCWCCCCHWLKLSAHKAYTLTFLVRWHSKRVSWRIRFLPEAHHQSYGSDRWGISTADNVGISHFFWSVAYYEKPPPSAISYKIKNDVIKSLIIIVPSRHEYIKLARLVSSGSLALSARFSSPSSPVENVITLLR